MLNTTKAPPRRLGMALLVIAAAQLMLVLDVTIMNVALPSIQSALDLAPSNLNWVITGYALGFGGLLLVGGRAGDLFGRRRVFRAGLVLFTVASLLGGLAPTGAVLIGARALQGIGAAIAAPTALSLLATTFPAGPRRNRALGVYGAMGGVGAVAGLLLGGALTNYLDWRWVLFINVPIAVLVLAGSRVLVEGDRDRGRMDLPGAVTATAGFAALVYAINRASNNGWSDEVTIGFLLAAAVLLVAFLVIQHRAKEPMLPSRVLKNRSRGVANLVLFLSGSGMFATLYFLTLYMQGVLGYSPMQTGLAYLPFAVGIGLIGGGVGPKLLAHLSPRTVTGVGLLIAAAGTAWFGLLTPGSNQFAVLLPAQLVAGMGLGLIFVTSTIVAVRGVAPQDSGIASGLVNASMQIGGALGLAVLVAVASASTRSLLPAAALPDALTHGYVTGLLVAAGLYLAALVMVLIIGERRSTPDAPEAVPHTSAAPGEQEHEPNPGSFNGFYQGAPPWETEKPQPAVVDMAEQGLFTGRILDIGCGTGENALLLSARGHSVLGIDGAALAIERAKKKAQERGLNAEFAVADALDLPALGQKFDTVLDSAFLHIPGNTADRRRGYTHQLASVVPHGGWVHLLEISEQIDQHPSISSTEIVDSFDDQWTNPKIHQTTYAITTGDLPAWQVSIQRR